LTILDDRDRRGSPGIDPAASLVAGSGPSAGASGGKKDVSTQIQKDPRLGDRVLALKNLPRALRLVWDASPGVVSGIVLSRIAAALVPLGVLLVTKRVIDLAAAVGRTHGPVPARTAWLLLGAGFLLGALALLFGRVSDYLEARLADEFNRTVSLRVMRHAAALDLASFEDASFYDQLERARVQATDRAALLTAMGSLVQRLVGLAALALSVVYYSPWLFAVLLVCVVPTFAGESHFAFRGYTLARRMTPLRRELDYLRVLGSSRESAKEVKMFALGGHLYDRYREVSEKLIGANRALGRRRLLGGTLLGILGSLGYYGGYAYLVWEALRGSITVGTLTFLAGATAAANTELQTLFSLFSSISEQALFLTDLLAFLSVSPRIVSRPGALPAPRPIRDGIEFRRVSFRYPGSDRLVLRDLELRMAKDERVALVAENGAGKTTFVKLLARLYEPADGEILLDGVDLRDYRIEDLHNEIGVVFQDFFRYDMAVRENIAAGRVELVRDDSALWEAARKSGADRMVAQLPRQLEQMLGRRFEGGVDLSGGQWQRMALARAYLRDAQVLILDEPTASLDAVAEAQVFAKFAELAREKMAILISHRFSTVRMADRILVLEDGRIAEEGTHGDLVARAGQYARLFEMQAANYR
jgi:ATP-binding cassette subfamily B protein